MQSIIKPVENKILTINEAYPCSVILCTSFLYRKNIPIKKLTELIITPISVTTRKGKSVEYMINPSVVFNNDFVV